jgi:hypothetical protein
LVTAAPAPVPSVIDEDAQKRLARDLQPEQHAALVSLMDKLLEASSLRAFDMDQLMAAVAAQCLPISRGAARALILHLMYMDPRARDAAGLPQMCWYGNDYINKVEDGA